MLNSAGSTIPDTWDRERIENIKSWERPAVRCRYRKVLVDEDGQSTESITDCSGKIHTDGNSVWVVCQVGGTVAADDAKILDHYFANGNQLGNRISWDLLLEILNDKYASPLFFDVRVEYEV